MVQARMHGLARFAPRLAASLDQLRRDARMVVGDWRGERHPIVPRPAGERARPRRSAEAARPLRVVDVIDETPEARSLILRDPAGRPLAFVPGQFFTVLVDIDGRTHRRAYSISSSHLETAQVRITVKRMAGGRVSSFLNERIAPGQLLRVLGPSGSFLYEPTSERAGHLVLVGGGSGITPLMAIARAALTCAPDTKVSLLYGNRRRESIIFHDELAALHAAYPQRLHVRHVLEQTPAGQPADWMGGHGRLDEPTLRAELELLGDLSDAVYYVCGPEPMMAAARAALHARNVPGSRIREERFSSPHLRSDRSVPTGEPQPVTVHLAGRTHVVQAGPGETILDAGLAAGLPMTFSCAMGGCGACRVKLRAGSVAAEEPNCLSDAELRAGYVLACVSRPASPVTVEAG